MNTLIERKLRSSVAHNNNSTKTQNIQQQQPPNHNKAVRYRLTLFQGTITPQIFVSVYFATDILFGIQWLETGLLSLDKIQRLSTDSQHSVQCLGSFKVEMKS